MTSIKCANGRNCYFRKRGICKFDHSHDDIKPILKPRFNGYLVKNPIDNNISFADRVKGNHNNFYEFHHQLGSIDDEIKEINNELGSIDDEIKEINNELVSIDDEIKENNNELVSIDDEIKENNNELESIDDESTIEYCPSNISTPDISHTPIIDWCNTPDELLYPKYNPQPILYKVICVLSNTIESTNCDQ
jgi:hypothetical protein